MLSKLKFEKVHNTGRPVPAKTVVEPLQAEDPLPVQKVEVQTTQDSEPAKKVETATIGKSNPPVITKDKAAGKKIK